MGLSHYDCEAQSGAAVAPALYGLMVLKVMRAQMLFAKQRQRSDTAAVRRSVSDQRTVQ